ncbi:MAG: START domain-containing protein [Spirochaetota bacterium]
MHKKQHSLTIRVLFAALILFPCLVSAGSGWNLIKDSDGIQVYNKEIDGSDIKEFKAVAVIDSPIEVIFEVMADVPAGTRWIDNCIENRIVKNIGDTVVAKDKVYSKNLVYSAIGAPFPVKNRDLVVETETKWDINARSVFIGFHAAADPAVPVSSRFVRITELKGSWSFESIDNVRTRAVYQVKQNPGGYLPSFMVNYANKEIPYKTIMGLRKIAKDEKYTAAAKSRKKE